MGSNRLWIPLGVCVLGVCFAHHPMLLSGMRQIQVDHEDPRLINYILEHGYQWLIGAPLHHDLWSPPVFHPAPRALAFSDTLLSVGPLYWAARLAGLKPDTSFQVWMIVCLIINYFLFYLLLRSRLHLGEFASAMGAFLFAYGAPRVADIGHPQLLPEFFSVLAILVLFWLLERSQRSLGQRLAGWSVVQLAIVAQFYASFYLGWFLVFSLLMAFLFALVLPRLRPGLLATLNRDLLVIATTAIVPAILISPLMNAYLEVAWLSGYRSLYEVSLAIPKLHSWIYSGPDHWLYWWMTKHRSFLVFGSLEPAHRMGVGLLTPLICLAGLGLRRDQGFVQILVITGLTIFLVVTSIPRDVFIGLAMSQLCFCLSALWWYRDNPRALIVPAVFGSLLVWWLIPLVNLWLACQIAAVSIIPGLILPQLRRFAFALTGWLVPLFLLVGCFPDKPAIIACAVVSVLAARAIPEQKRAGLLNAGFYTLVLVTLALLTRFHGEVVVWKYVYHYLPAGGAIRVTARVVLLMLIPLSVGFALFWEWFGARSRWKYVLPLGLFCLLEQGVTTTVFDKLEARQRAERITSRVKAAGNPRMFFYSSSRTGLPDWNDHVDAMWAEISSGVPTVNGYSGIVPVGWGPLYDCSFHDEEGEIRLASALGRWAYLSNLRPDQITWLHDDRELRTPSIAQATRPAEDSSPRPRR